MKEKICVVIVAVTLWFLGYEAGHINGAEQMELEMKRVIVKMRIGGKL
jgi:hypothetical protein